MPAVEIVAPGSTETKEVKSLRALVEGRVGIEQVRPGLVEAWVRCLHGHVHHPRWERGRGWSCDCEARPSVVCYHAGAVARIVVLPDAGERGDWGSQIARE